MANRSPSDTTNILEPPLKCYVPRPSTGAAKANRSGCWLITRTTGMPAYLSCRPVILDIGSVCQLLAASKCHRATDIENRGLMIAIPRFPYHLFSTGG